MVHTFCPLTTHSSPSRTARVARPATSEPAPGSLNSWHQISWLVASARRSRCFMLLGAPRDDRRATHADADDVERPRHLVVVEHLVDDARLRRARATARRRTRPATWAWRSPPRRTRCTSRRSRGRRATPPSFAASPASTASIQPAGRCSASHSRVCSRSSSAVSVGRSVDIGYLPLGAARAYAPRRDPRRGATSPATTAARRSSIRPPARGDRPEHTRALDRHRGARRRGRARTRSRPSSGIGRDRRRRHPRTRANAPS